MVPAGEILCVAWPSGRVLWRRTNHRGTELSVLPNGNILYIEDPKGVVTEIDPQQKVVWQYKTENASIMSAERLENGNTLLVDDSTASHLRSDAGWKDGVECREARIQRARRCGVRGERETALRLSRYRTPACCSRSIRKATSCASGSFLIVCRRYAKPLPDGGMLIGLAGPGEVRRVDASGKTS